MYIYIYIYIGLTLNPISGLTRLTCMHLLTYLPVTKRVNLGLTLNPVVAIFCKGPRMPLALYMTYACIHISRVTPAVFPTF